MARRFLPLNSNLESPERAQTMLEILQELFPEIKSSNHCKRPWSPDC